MPHHLDRCIIENIGIVTITTIPIIGEMDAGDRTVRIGLNGEFAKGK
jgi:hypothetical protein